MNFNTVDIVGQIADLKDVDYKNTLALATLIELLSEKGLFSQQEFTQKAQELDHVSLAEFALKQKNKTAKNMTRSYCKSNER